VCAHNTPAHWWATNAVNRLKKDIPIIWYCHEPHRLTYFSITDEISVKNVQNDSIGSLPNQEAFAQRIRKRVRHQRVLKSRWRRKQDATAVKSISSILANSQFTQENVKRAFGKDSKVCYPGIPESDKKPTYFSNRKGIVFLSNFVPSKNVFGMLGAVDKIVNQAGRKDIQFHFLGEGNSPEIQNYLKHKGLESYTEFHGFVSELEKQELLGSVRLCAFIPFCEPFGLVTLEAFRSGTPAIVSDHGGPAEVINNSGAGITVNPFDVESIAKGILGTYDDVEKLERMSEAGQKILCDGFYIKHLTDRFEQNFKMLMDGF
jgi:glycosyltransferase involved in cell wall biosynthesis